MGGMSPSSCFTALASSSSSRDGMAGLPARRRRAATLFGLPAGAFCLESRTKGPVDIGGRLAGIPVGAVRVPLPGQPCPPNPSSFPGMSHPVPLARRRRICPARGRAQRGTRKNGEGARRRGAAGRGGRAPQRPRFSRPRALCPGGSLNRAAPPPPVRRIPLPHKNTPHRRRKSP